jgi:hypothetical protein
MRVIEDMLVQRNSRFGRKACASSPSESDLRANGTTRRDGHRVLRGFQRSHQASFEGASHILCV